MANIHSISEKSWNEARRRGRAIGALYKKGLERTKADVIDAAKRLHLSVSHVYLLLKRYQANPKTSTLLPAKKGWITGKSRIAPAQEVVIQTVLDELYLTGERPGVSDIMDEIWRRCRKKGIPAPTEPTVRLRIARLDSRTVTKKREGARKAQEIYTPAGESPSCDHPLQIVQMDHTLVDLIIVDKVLRQPICRPWITLAIDVFTRMVLGFLLTLERPSTATVALALAQAILPKDTWLRARGIDYEWPARGFPEILNVDNAKEFKATPFKIASDEYEIIIPDRKPRRPTHGAHIERLIGTQMGAVHMLPGTTFSNTVERGDYDSEKHATLIFEEAEKWIAIEILGKYHQEIHRTLGVPPIFQWQAHIDRSVDERLNALDQQRIFLDFLPFKWRTIGRQGIVLNNIWYWEDVLSTWLGAENRKVMVKYFPPDMSYIYVLDETGRYWKIGFRDKRLPKVSLYEIRSASKELRERGRAAVDEEVIFKAITQQRELVEDAKAKRKSARKNAEQTRITAERNIHNVVSPTSVDEGALGQDDAEPLSLYENEVPDEFEVEVW